MGWCRGLTVVAGVVAVALVLPVAAAAKHTRVVVAEPSVAPRVGVAWALTVRVTLDGKPYARRGYHPVLYLLDKAGNQIATFHGKLVALGRYRIAIVFPHAGAWRYAISDPIMGSWHYPRFHVSA
jgi:hypothetical protein